MNINYLIVPLLAAFAAAAVLGPVLIPVLRRLKFGQTERAEGVQSHLKKAGTPTMGGIIFLIGIFIVSIAFSFRFREIVPVVILTGGFAVTGFIDDYLKVVRKNSDGLSVKQKLLLEFIFTTVFLIYLLKRTGISLDMRIPFGGGRMLSLGWFGIPFLYIVVLAVVNGVNFTDGLDGLASSVTSVVAAAFCVAAVMLKSGAAPAAAAVVGGLCGFLLYNVFPAKVFMGDTGSLALGGFVAGMAYVLQMPLFIPIIGLIYAIELLSVVLQVSYFKLTHGKRIFKMTPIHHHFELCGWSEPRIVAVFTIITVLLSIVGLAAL